jgi:hypothetical protein
LIGFGAAVMQAALRVHVV